MEMQNNVPLMVDKMKKNFLSEESKHDLLGKLIEKSMLYEYSSISGKVKLSPNTVIKAYEAVYMDSTSKFFKKDEEATMYDLYISFLEQNREGYSKDPVNPFEKSFLVAELLNIIPHAGN